SPCCVAAFAKPPATYPSIRRTDRSTLQAKGGHFRTRVPENAHPFLFAISFPPPGPTLVRPQTPRVAKMEATARQQLKDDVLRLRGYWHKFHDGLMDMAPDYLAAYLAFQNAPAVSANIEPKVCEFIYIAADGAVSHLYASGAARHIEMALDKGAT